MGLGRAPTPEQNCMTFLGEQYDLWNDAHGSPDEFFKLRLSLIELLFREAESILRGLSPKLPTWTASAPRLGPVWPKLAC